MEFSAEEMKLIRRGKHSFVRLAWASVLSYVKYRMVLSAEGLPKQITEEIEERDWVTLRRPSGCFVTLHIDSELRGCIGTIEPQEKTLAEEIIENAISSATRDPRFPPVQIGELESISISVDVLSPPVPANYEDIDPKNLGIIVEQGFRRGLLLPNLPGVDTKEAQLRIAAQKAGIDLESPFNIYVFRSDRYY